MIDEIKQLINKAGGLIKFKQQRKRDWDNQDELLKEKIEKLLRLSEKDLPNHQRVIEIGNMALSMNKLKRFVDINLIDECIDPDESYSDILFRVLNKYMEIKRKSNYPSVKKVLDREELAETLRTQKIGKGMTSINHLR
jgi:hypothetical protein